jgi:hypothetical protein
MSVSNPATFNPAGVVSTNSAGIVTTAASANYQASPDMFSDGLMATPIHAFGGTDSNIDAAAGKFVSRQTGGKKKRKAMRKQRKTANKRSRGKKSHVAKKTRGKKSKRARGKKSKRVRFL